MSTSSIENTQQNSDVPMNYLPSDIDPKKVGRIAAATLAAGAVGLTGLAYFAVDRDPKPATDNEPVAASLYETATEQAIKNGSSLAEGDIPPVLETALLDYQKMWDHDSLPVAESTSRLKAVASGDIDINMGDQLDVVVTQKYLDMKLSDSGKIPQSIINSLRRLDSAYEAGLPSGSVHAGDKMTLQIVTDPNDPDHTTWAVVTDPVGSEEQAYDHDRWLHGRL